ncbi:MAG: hypothetical protein M3N14_03900 [Bacteroidota bacterium]|nr:hypothetical protein [Bacteroidota bacterium]
MEDKKHLIPEVAVRSVATGLCLMAFFTMLWSGIAYGGLKDGVYVFALIFFPVLAITFLSKAIHLFKIVRQFPKLTSESDIAEEKKTGKWFGIIVGAEGLGIFIAINVVINLGHPELQIPVIALVVGLHFYPLARVFKRKVDYYLATWSTLIAVLAIVFSLNKTLALPGILAFTGVGIAIATSCYGMYMLSRSKKIVVPEAA